jgi:hypothetical protein
MSECKQARPHSELIAEMLDSRIPKTEREHAAAREIERLRSLCDDLYSDLLAAGSLTPHGSSCPTRGNALKSWKTKLLELKSNILVTR